MCVCIVIRKKLGMCWEGRKGDHSVVSGCHPLLWDRQVSEKACTWSVLPAGVMTLSSHLSSVTVHMLLCALSSLIAPVPALDFLRLSSPTPALFWPAKAKDLCSFAKSESVLIPPNPLSLSNLFCLWVHYWLPAPLHSTLVM